MKTAGHDRISAYLALIESQPHWFVNHPGGVDVVTDPKRLREIETTMGACYRVRGYPAAWAEVGIHYQDPYIIILRDAVVFPDGSPGIHHRALRLGADPSGVAILPVHRGRVVLCRHFRHPLRGWSWEVPRGAIDGSDGADTAARKELAEEIGADIVTVTRLGRLHGTTGLMGITVLLYFATLAAVGKPAAGEGIVEVKSVSVGELEEMIRSSEITDAFSIGCFTHARLRGLI